MLRLRRPSDSELHELVDVHRDDPFTYDAVGATTGPVNSWPPGYRRLQRSVDIGDTGSFEAAVARLRDWAPQRDSGLVVAADGQVAEQRVVALAAPLPLGWVVATCRVVYVESSADSFAWAYGTLPLHPESGEERFQVGVVDGRAVFTVSVFARPHHWSSRALPPLTNLMQDRATAGYLRAMGPT